MNHPNPHLARPARWSRRGSAMIAVIWGLAALGMIVAGLQVTSGRMLLEGRDAMERIKARWAARAGVESTIATLALHTRYPVPMDAYALIHDLDAVHIGDVSGGNWLIQHNGAGSAAPFAGPMDEHSKLNVNGEFRGLVNTMFGPLAWGVFDAIEDWIDEDDEPGEFGVERDYYLSLDARYEPRNGLLHNVAELELVAGIEPEEIRGEDWNMNNRLDPEERDGDELLPLDDGSDTLDGGWSAMLTTRSVAGGSTDSGEPRIWLRNADATELIDRFAWFGLELLPEKADSVLGMARQEDFSLDTLVSELGMATAGSGEADDGEAGQVDTSLTPDEVAILLSETIVEAPHRPALGRLNINTVPADTLYAMLEGQERLVENLLALRTQRAAGLTSVVDLWALPEADPDGMAQLTRFFDTRSNVFTITSRGFSKATGQEAEIVVTVDRSSVPVRILDIRED
ncbi:MAG: type II secretion system protein GspK [Phycisphaerales bacterium]|nr:type II secretion system protein GspK [Phycisphaerales bacterium]